MSGTKEKIIQFGEGGFLRSFVDVFIHKMNEQGLYDGKVVVVQPIEKGLIPVINEQHGVYHHPGGKIARMHTEGRAGVRRRMKSGLSGRSRSLRTG